MRIAIVNDLAMAVEVLRRIVESQPRLQLAWVAKDGREAVEMCRRDRPDLILMDLIMPVMDGVEATRLIMENSPCAILVVTVSVGVNMTKVFDAMGHGALDAVDTPRLGPDGTLDGAEELLRKINLISRLTVAPPVPLRSKPAGRLAPDETDRMIAIGSSTGGPRILAEIFKALPVNLAAAIVVVQHVDYYFAPALVRWLSEQTEIPVRQIATGDIPRNGTIWVAGTNDHLYLDPRRKFDYRVEPEECPYRPSVDTFFDSLHESWPHPHMAVLLTGMGKDGARGLLALRKAGWHTIAQDEATSVIYGMPRAARDIDAAVEILPPKAIAARMADFGA